MSARALAESAVRAGYRCATADYFGDLDLVRLGPNVALGPERREAYTAEGLVRAAESVEAEAVAYGASLENHPGLVARLAAGRELWGNGPETLTAVRDPARWVPVVRDAGVAVPETLLPETAGSADAGRRWLCKPRAGGGGIGVARWRPGVALSPGAMAQEEIAGVPGSAIFLADGRRATLWALTRQLVGVRALGVSGYRYCGSLMPFTEDTDCVRDVEAQVGAAVLALTEAFALRGACGLDFVVDDGRVFVLETNPRHTASMELLERACGVSIFEAHVRACRGDLPAAAPAWPGGAFGKAILFARRRTRLDDTRTWLRAGVRDVPRPGTVLARGAPICTIFARGRSVSACASALERRAEAWRARIELPRRRRHAS